MTMLERCIATMSRPWNWGIGWHCLGDASDVFLDIWGVDPMAGLRGRYSDTKGAIRIMRDAGGLTPLAQREFASTGLVRREPVPGCIGIGLGDDYRPAALIYLGDSYWAGKGRYGCAVVPAQGVEAWGI